MSYADVQGAGETRKLARQTNVVRGRRSGDKRASTSEHASKEASACPDATQRALRNGWGLQKRWARRLSPFGGRRSGTERGRQSCRQNDSSRSPVEKQALAAYSIDADGSLAKRARRNTTGAENVLTPYEVSNDVNERASAKSS